MNIKFQDGTYDTQVLEGLSIQKLTELHNKVKDELGAPGHVKLFRDKPTAISRVTAVLQAFKAVEAQNERIAPAKAKSAGSTRLKVDTEAVINVKVIDNPRRGSSENNARHAAFSELVKFHGKPVGAFLASTAAIAKKRWQVKTLRLALKDGSITITEAQKKAAA